MRRAHPTWGPLKARAFLERRGPGIAWPAASTIGLLFDREGLTVKRKLRRRSPPSSAPFAHCGAANDVWCIDFKGWFLTGEGARCEPLTLTDATSRYLLRCQALARTDGPACVAGARRRVPRVRPAAQAALRQCSPFASIGVGGLSGLAVRVIKAGVKPERIAPGKPQQNGRHERMHLTLLKDAITPPAKTLREQLDRFRAFQRLYNGAPAPGARQRHPRRMLSSLAAALGRRAARARLSGRPRGPAGALRTARSNGGASSSISIARSPASRSASSRTPHGWTVSFGPVVLGSLAHGADRLRKPKPARCGLVDDAARRPQGPQPPQQHNSPERNENCVTHLVGQTCYPCSRLLRHSPPDEGFAPKAHCFGSTFLRRPIEGDILVTCSLSAARLAARPSSGRARARPTSPAPRGRRAARAVQDV